jgi:drug/metabolite transporter (DMT)-like permease
MAALGIIGINVGQVTQALGVQRTSASAATMISATIPIFVVALSVFRLRETIRGRQALGLALALIGVGFVALGGKPSTGSDVRPSSAGDALVLVSAVSIALY